MSTYWIRAAHLALAVVLTTACASGRDFKRPDPTSFVLGRTTEGEIRDRFGDPRGEGTLLANDRTIKILRYAYAEAAPYVEKVPVRAMVYSFHEGTLIGFDYASSFSSDKTDFDESLVSKIHRGQTTKAQVVEIFGQPTGMFIYPSSFTKTADQRAYVYSYSRTDKDPMGVSIRNRTKTLAITFDNEEIVTDINLSTGGSK